MSYARLRGYRCLSEQLPPPRMVPAFLRLCAFSNFPFVFLHSELASAARRRAPRMIRRCASALHPRAASFTTSRVFAACPTRALTVAVSTARYAASFNGCLCHVFCEKYLLVPPFMGRGANATPPPDVCCAIDSVRVPPAIDHASIFA